MKSILFVCLALGVASFSVAEDDGQYQPGKYGGDDGKYRGDDGRYRYDGKYQYDGRYQYNNRNQYDGRYYNRYDVNDYYRNGKYNSIYSAYQPLVVSPYTPYQQLVAPVVTYAADGSIEYTPLASSASGVKYKPVTARPVVKAVQSIKPFDYPYYARQYQYTNDHTAKILRQDVDQDVDAYHYVYQTENGITAEETGRVDTPGRNGGTRASGFYEYIGDDGNRYRVDYVADENGFQPRGAHLP